MEAEQIHLTEERETLLITLYSRAMDNRREAPILGDKTAEDVARRIDYDFRKLKIHTVDQFIIVTRAKYLDEWTAGFLADNPDATVLHLGCGLDSRVFRINPPASVRWYDLDYPEVIELRRRLYPQRAGYHMIGASVTDSHWLDQVPADRPVMIVAEGLTMYLSERDGKQLLQRLTDHFASGHMAFDAFSRLAVQVARLHHSIRATGASFGWAIDDPHEIEKWNPRLQLVMEIALTDSAAISKLLWWQRMVLRVVNHIPAMKRAHRLLRYRF